MNKETPQIWAPRVIYGEISVSSLGEMTGDVSKVRYITGYWSFGASSTGIVFMF